MLEDGQNAIKSAADDARKKVSNVAMDASLAARPNSGSPVSSVGGGRKRRKSKKSRRKSKKTRRKSKKSRRKGKKGRKTRRRRRRR